MQREKERADFILDKNAAVIAARRRRFFFSATAQGSFLFYYSGAGTHSGGAILMNEKSTRMDFFCSSLPVLVGTPIERWREREGFAIIKMRR